MCQLLLFLLAILEACKSRLLPSNNTSTATNSSGSGSGSGGTTAGAAEVEAACSLCLRCYKAVLSMWGQGDSIYAAISSMKKQGQGEDRDTTGSASTNTCTSSSSSSGSSDMLVSQRPLSGSLLAQCVHACLGFAAHSDPDISHTALQLFLELLQRTRSNLSDWRSYFPGAFSSLYKLCLSRRSYTNISMPVTAAVCICQLMLAVCSDAVPEHKRFDLQYQHRHHAHAHTQTQAQTHTVQHVGTPTAAGDSDTSATVEVDAQQVAQALLDNLKRKAGGVSAGGGGTAHVASQVPPPAPAPAPEPEEVAPFGFPSVAAFLKWRVDVSQRLRDHVPTALSVVIGSSGHRQRSILPLITLVAEVIIQCRHFLGTSCIVAILPLLLQAVQHPSHAVRHEAQRQWQVISEREVRCRYEQQRVVCFVFLCFISFDMLYILCAVCFVS
jgi:hypothetical protein